MTGEAPRFRPEIQGLRLLAALLVAGYHVWSERSSGAVDVFFVVTGFLIIGSLVRRADGRGSVDVIAFWSRIARRIIPAAYLVLGFALAGTSLVVSRVYWAGTVDEIVAAALYMANWQFAANAVDYNAHGEFQSPVLHYWALSIQGQFYLIAPLVAGCLLVVARRLRTEVRRVAIVFLVVAFVLSFATAIVATRQDQTAAYFNAGARAWQFALGGLLALLIDRIVVGDRWRHLGAWAGLVAIVTTGVLIDVGASFPGPLTLVPTLGAVLVILGGDAARPGRVSQLLASRPLQSGGDISYALFLWHWPIYVFTLQVLDTPRLSFVQGAGVILVSIVLARVTTTWVEAPVRRLGDGPTGRRRLGPAEILGMAAVPLLLLTLATTGARQPTFAEASEVDLGAAPVPLTDEVTPDPVHAALDRPQYQEGRDCHDRSTRRGGGADAVSCRFGVVGGQPVVALVGGSHSAQWQPALDAIAHKRGWELVTFTRGGCQFSDEHRDAVCDGWNESVTRTLLDHPPDLVVTTSSTARGVERVPDGFVTRWQVLNDAGIPVLGLRDNPEFPFNVPECVEEHGATSLECALPRGTALAPTYPVPRLGLPTDVHVVDLTHELCTREWCHPARGDVLMYRDRHHLTTTFVMAIADVLEVELQRQASALMSRLDA